MVYDNNIDAIIKYYDLKKEINRILQRMTDLYNKIYKLDIECTKLNLKVIIKIFLCMKMALQM